jgi:hypothetical protein
MPHTLCVIATHHSKTAIQEFPRPLQRLIGSGPDMQIVIEGLAETLMKCFNHNLLPGELNEFSWARRCEAVNVDALGNPNVTHKRQPKVEVTLSVSRNRARV